MRNINPNQFALPGMEKDAHPLAGHVAAGVSFKLAHYSVDHELTAHSASGGGLGALSWANAQQRRHPSGAGHYPGEITGVSRHPATPKKDFRPGLMTDMYKAGHQLNMGQDTVPIHSPDRTEAGEAWSAKVGGPRPKLGDFDWKPPADIHPYERRNLSQSQFKPPGNDQPPLPGMEAHSHERKVDLGHVLKNWIK